MIKFKNTFIYKFLKKIYQFFLTIYIFESHKKFKSVNKKGISLFIIKSLNEIKLNKIIKKYFENSEFKLDRFKKKSKFIGLRRGNEIICSGWIYFGNQWKIEEINRKKVSVIDNDELVLKRSKPLKSNIHNIRKILGITE